MSNEGGAQISFSGKASISAICSKDCDGRTVLVGQLSRMAMGCGDHGIPVAKAAPALALLFGLASSPAGPMAGALSGRDAGDIGVKGIWKLKSGWEAARDGWRLMSEPNRNVREADGCRSWGV